MDKELEKGGITVAEFGKYLKAIREKKGFGVNQLAMLTGVSPSLISRVENGKRGAPKGGTIDELSKVLKVSQYEMYFMAGNQSILQMNPEFEFSDIAYKYMNEEDLEIINKYKRETQQSLREAKKILNKELSNTIGERIKILREEKGITHQQLASDLGFEGFIFYNIESGDYRPDPELVSLIADYFNVSADYLLGRTEHPDRVNYKKTDVEPEELVYNGQAIKLSDLNTDQRILIDWALSHESLSFKDKPQDFFELLDLIRNIKPHIEELEKKREK